MYEEDICWLSYGGVIVGFDTCWFMLVGLGWAHTSVCHVISVVYFVLVYIYSINGCASPRGKGAHC